jgi:chromosome segregation ATPase
MTLIDMQRSSAMLVLALGTTLSLAQAPATSSDAGRTLSMGNSKANSKLLTMEELRACFKQRDLLQDRLKTTDAARAGMDNERAAIGKEQETLKAERETMGGLKGAVDDLNNKTREFQAQVDAWQKKVAEFNEKGGSGRSVDRQRDELNKENEALVKRQNELQAERTALTARSEQVVKDFNARAAALDQRVASWNERNNKMNREGEALTVERETWVAECGDRRYREDDEKAILSGK